MLRSDMSGEGPAVFEEQEDRVASGLFRGDLEGVAIGLGPVVRVALEGEGA